MNIRRKRLCNKVVSFMLAAIMVFSVFAAAPTEVEAATKSFKSTGTSSVTITDAQSYDLNGYGKMAAHYIKFKATNNGYITIKMKDASKKYTPAGYLTFCDSKKKALGQKREVWSTNSKYKGTPYYTRSFGVKKGKTYYIKIESSAGVKVTATFKKVTKSKYNSKSKANTLKKNTTAKGVIIAGDKTVDWYKIKLTSSKRVKLTYTAKTNGDTDNSGIKISFCKADGSLYIPGSTTQDPSYDWVSPWTSSGWSTYYRTYISSGKETGLEAGTYYIKVERYNKTSSGYYTLKWSTY